MDRSIVYSGQKPRSADLLVAERAALVGLASLTQALLGQTNTVASGLVATPGAGLTIVMGSGSLYSLVQLDPTAYGSLLADTTDLYLKQGLQAGSVTLTGFNAPGIAGQSINYLIQAQYQDIDTTPVLLQYWNSANPTQYFQGPGGAGGTNFTIRSGQIVYQILAGTAATTGTQTTPAATIGWTGLYAITVTNGQTTIPSGQISAISGAPFLAGLLNSHHNGAPGQAPQVKLGSPWIRAGATNFEVQNRLPAASIQASDDVGTFSAVQVFAGNPNGNLAGNAGIIGQMAPSLSFDPSLQLIWVCTTSGTTSTAVWQKYPRIISGEYAYINSSQSLQPGMYLVDTTAGPVTITLEAPGTATVGDNYTFLDYGDSFAANNLILNPNGGTIQNGGNMACDVNGVLFTISFASNNWTLQ